MEMSNKSGVECDRSDGNVRCYIEMREGSEGDVR